MPDLGIMDVPMIDDVTEVLGMLEQEPRTWADQMRDEGRAEVQWSMVAMLLLQARMRFGDGLAERLANLLEGITDTDRLMVIGEWIMVCESGEELLAQVHKS